MSVQLTIKPTNPMKITTIDETRSLIKIGKMCTLRLVGNWSVYWSSHFKFAGNTSEIYKLLITSFRKISSEFGIPIAEDKTQGPKTIITFLGIVIDTDKMVIIISNRKKLRAIYDKLPPKNTLGRLQSLIE